MEIFIGHINLQ